MFRPAMQNFFRAVISPEEVLHDRTKYWYLIYILNFAHICCCFSSHCGVPVFKLVNCSATNRDIEILLKVWDCSYPWQSKDISDKLFVFTALEKAHFKIFY